MNTRITFLLFIFLLASALAFLDNLAFHYFLYWRFWWYDVMMHFLAGAVIGATYLWLAHFEGPKSHRAELLNYSSVFLFVFLVGAVWEAFEIVIRVNPEYSRVYWAFDTLKDLCMDVLGGSVAYWVTKQLIRNNA